MKLVFWFLCAIIAPLLIGGSLASVSAQTSSPTPDPFTVQLTSSPVGFNSTTSDISANGRFVVFTSNGDVATQNKNNADGNREIYRRLRTAPHLSDHKHEARPESGAKPESDADAESYAQPDRIAEPNTHSRPNARRFADRED